jgi:integrase
MLLAPGNATSAPEHHDGAEAPQEVLAAYHAHQGRTGRGNSSFTSAAKCFLHRWPLVQDWAVEPLDVQLSASTATRPFITFLLVTGRLRPSWEYLVHRKFSSLWRALPGTRIGDDVQEFITAARAVGYSERVASAMASQVMARVLFATGKPLHEITHDDFDALTAAGQARQEATGRTWRHYRACATATRTVLFHHGVLPALPPSWEQRWSFARRLAGVPEPMHSILVRYLNRKSVTCKPATVSSLATRLAHFGAFITSLDADLTPDGLDRVTHIEPWLVALTRADNTKSGGVLSVAEQARRILAVANFCSDITEWDWPEAPSRKLLYASDTPRLPQPLPRFLPPAADQALTQALTDSPHRLAADALLLQRACGLRIGELLDLELDAVIDVPGAGSWLKVPLGKLDTERMVPIDTETLTLIDRISTTRSPGRPIPHPRTGRPADFLFTAHGHRLSQNRLRAELDRAATTAGLGHITPHQLRHTYATALVNAGVSLQALMVILGHVSAEMSLRYARLFDTTIRSEYERALTLAKSRLGPLPTPHRGTDDPDQAKDWRTTPTVKTALAGGYCLRAPAQGPCAYANLCEHCPAYRTTSEHIPVLTRQRDDAAALAHDAADRGWDAETERHLRLITRLNTHIDQAATRRPPA